MKKTNLNIYEEKINKLQEEVKVEKERTLMVLADFENFKKRVGKEREEMNLLGNATLLNILLEIIDDLKRGLDDMNEAPQGLVMIMDKVKLVLDENGVTEYEINVGDTFNPKNMEAIGTITVKDKDQDGKVIHVDRKGYKIKDKDFIMRGARVIVGKFSEK